MKTKLCLGIFLLAAPILRAQTNDLTALLQQGLFEEQANRNLDAAIADYQTLATQFDQDRQLAATAVFRLGECYRAQGKTNEAAAQYQRILRDFSDQQTLATLSRQDLAGMGMAPQSSPAASPGGGATLDSLRSQYALLKAQLEQAKNETNFDDVARLFGDSRLTYALVNLQKTRDVLKKFQVNHSPSDWIQSAQTNVTNAEHDVQAARQQLFAYQELRLNILQSAIQQARGEQPAQTAGMNETAPVTGDEDREIARIQQMIQNSPDLINAPDSHGHTPLENAAINGWLKVAAFLLDHGADVNARGGLALVDAVQAGNRTMLEFLLAHGANVNAMNPLFTAVQHGFEAVTKVLLANKADVNGRDSQGNTPLFVAAQRGRTKILQMLLAAGAKVNVENNQGRTPLSFVADYSPPETIKMLLDAKADPNTGTLDAPLLCAIHEKGIESAQLLLQAGANPNAKGEVDWQPSYAYQWMSSIPGNRGWATPLWLAIDMNQIPMVQLLLKYKADPNDTQIGNESLLFDALGNTNMLEALLNDGAKPDALDNIVNQRATPLEYAARAGNAAAVEILLRHGADPNFRDFNGDTPLHYAAFNDAPSRQVFELLLSHDANPNVRNRIGKTPLDLIKDKEQPFRPGFGQPMGFGSSFLPGAYPRPAGAAEPAAWAGQLAGLLRQHGALDVLPDWDRITVSRPANHFSAAVFQRGTNDWNHFTLLELLYQIDYFGNYYKQGISFPDLTRVVIARPTDNGAKSQRITVNLLNGTNGVDCARDVPLKFGDVVEIPEREHSLAEKAYFLSGDQAMTILNYFRNRAGEAKLIVAGGQTVELPLQPFYSQIGQVLSRDNARAALTSSSDLSRVKVTRRDPETGKTAEWTLDCSNQNNQGVPDLWLRAGDVIEVPLKP